MTSRVFYISALILLWACGEDSDTHQAPEIVSISPTSAFEGEEVIIEGAYFSFVSKDNIVRIGGVQAQITAASDTMLKILVPDGAADGSVTVRVGSLSATSNEKFTVLVNLEKEIGQAMSLGSIPSLAMAVIAENKLSYANGFGQYDAARSKDADEHTLYITSSISKLIVSIGVMQQVELGKVDLDQDISNFVGFEVRNPNFPNQVITVEMVMQHGSSLSNPAFGEIVDDVFETLKPDSVVALHPIIEEAITPGSSIYKESIWMNVAPGTLHKNSNYGIILLAYMVERLSGLHFNDYSTQHILGPLGMVSSSFYFPEVDASKDAVIYDGTGAVIEPFSYFFYAAGLLRTSVTDWSQLMFMMLNQGTYNGNKILASSSVDALLDVKYPAGNNLAYDSSIGLVWRQGAGSDGWIGHTGGGLGITHVTEINREKKMAYVILSNRVGNGSMIGPGGTLYQKVHRWLNQAELNTN